MNKKLFDLKLYYFSVAVVVSLLTSVLPIFYESISMTPAQVGILISTTYVGALMQPVFGYICDRTQKPQLVLKILMIVAIIFSAILFFVKDFVVVLLVVLLLSLCYCSYFSLSDNVITAYVYQNNLNYGSIRRFASLGYGMAMLIATPLMLIFGVQSFIIIVIIGLIIAIVKLSNVDYHPIEKPHDSSYKNDVKEVLKMPLIVTLLSFQMLFMGINAIKFGYQAIKLQELFGTSTGASIALLLSTIPEFLFLALVSKYVDKYRPTTLLFFAVCASLIHVFTYAVVDNVYILIIVATCHGISMSFYLPVIPYVLRKTVNLRIIGTIFALIATLQSIVSLVVSAVVITPVYATLGINYVFAIFGIIMLVSLVFLARLRIKFKY